jgi:tRNA threonylcarbamoyladenosine biosynthesis protein TsaB
MENIKCLILAVETSGRLGSVVLAQGGRLLGERQFSEPLRHSAEVFPAIVGLLEQFAKKPVDIEQVYVSIGPGSFTGLRIAVTIAKTMALANQARIIAVDTLDVIAANVIALTGILKQSAIRNPQSEINRLAVILDAKRGQFFIAVYEQRSQHDLSLRAKRSNLNQREQASSIENRESRILSWDKILPDFLMTAEEFLSRFVNPCRKACCAEKPIALIGEGLVYYKDKFIAPSTRVLDEKYWNPSAANVHKLGLGLAKQGRFADPLALIPNYLRGPDVTVKSI